MQRVLRKGHSSVYLQYENVGDSIGVVDFVAGVQEDLVVLSFRLSPVDSNQAADEEHLHSKQLREIHLSDEYVLENLSDFLASPRVAGKGLAVEITSLGKILRFPIAIGPAGLGFLPLVVQREVR